MHIIKSSLFVKDHSSKIKNLELQFLLYFFFALSLMILLHCISISQINDFFPYPHTMLTLIYLTTDVQCQDVMGALTSVQVTCYIRLINRSPDLAFYGCSMREHRAHLQLRDSPVLILGLLCSSWARFTVFSNIQELRIYMKT